MEEKNKMRKIRNKKTNTDKKEDNKWKYNKGITLVALVVTIVVLIILATISINAVLGDKGLIRKAQQAKELHDQSVRAEDEAMNRLLQEYENALAGTPEDGNTNLSEYIDKTLPSTPRVAEGMQKVKYNSTSEKWEKVTDDGEEWYDYEKKEWANVVLPAEGTLDSLFEADGTLDESKKYVQLVWIPRYAYKITSRYHTGGSTAGSIEVVFIDTANQNKSKTTTYKTEYPSATNGGSMSDFVVHPAFNYGDKTLPGFWMGKFESSHTGCTTTASTGEATYTGNEVMMVKPNVTSWRNIKIGDAFTTCLNMNKAGNPYGLSNNDNIVDPHMVKNDEWGAVAYLSKSKYGKETEEVYINNSSDYITGNAGSKASASKAAGVTNVYNTTGGVKASTTGNVTGIYDMSGGSGEEVAAYITNGHGNLTDANYGKAVYEGATKYKNVYYSTVSDGSSAQAADYEYANPNYSGTYPNGYTKKYGDAVWETSSRPENSKSWYSDYSVFLYSNGPFFGRGGAYHNSTYAGVFCFSGSYGGAGAYGGFRVVVPVL